MITNVNPRHLSHKDLALLGVQDIAFVKSVRLEDETVYTIHAADGTQMGLSPTRDVAYAAIRQQGMEPVSVH
jgi:hypothetical protein